MTRWDNSPAKDPICQVRYWDEIDAHCWEKGTPKFLKAVLNKPTISPAQRQFQKLSERWYWETSHVSSTYEKAMNENYQDILGLGTKYGSRIISLVLKELEINGGYWFWALRHLSQTNPAKNVGNYQQAREIWLEWGRSKGHIE